MGCIELAQTRLKTTGVAELVLAPRTDLNLRRVEIEAERAARIEAERRLSAAEAAHLGLQRCMDDHSTRLAQIETDRDAMRDRLEAERNARVEAERERDIADALAIAATARADDLRAREADLRARFDQFTGVPVNSQPLKKTSPATPSKSTRRVRDTERCTGGCSAVGPCSGFEQKACVIHRAVQHVKNHHLFSFDAMEDQVMAMHAASNTVAFVPGHQRERQRSLHEAQAFLPQLLDKRERPRQIVAGDVIADAFKIAFGAYSAPSRSSIPRDVGPRFRRMPVQ